ncbi:hypothetical protein MNBD_UNCLBAC01-1795 [hydrothermal vent metagenome]|uniref:DUF4258 domain-containing protein n=1 Tax=hydrothermal vent metagenome TaxID=652676 RepID=A0A3B1D893_9ZZZZ
MFNRILRNMQEKIHACAYIMTPHARKEMNDDELSIYDVERVILTGSIVERQKDKVTTEWKYRIKGLSVNGENVEIVTKVSPTAKLIIIMVYAL